MDCSKEYEDGICYWQEFPQGTRWNTDATFFIRIQKDCESTFAYPSNPNVTTITPSSESKSPEKAEEPRAIEDPQKTNIPPSQSATVTPSQSAVTDNPEPEISPERTPESPLLPFYQRVQSKVVKSLLKNFQY